MKIVNTKHLGLTVIEVLTSIVVATIGVATGGGPEVGVGGDGGHGWIVRP